MLRVLVPINSATADRLARAEDGAELEVVCQPLQHSINALKSKRAQLARHGPELQVHACIC